MKKLTFILSFMLVMSLSFSGFAQDDDWTDMEWDAYSIGFKAPTGFDVDQNDAKAFTAKGAIFTMSIKPWTDAKITEAVDVAQKAFDITPGTEKTIISQGKLDGVQGLEAYEVYGVALQKGKGMHMIVAGFLNPNSDVNFTVQLLFWDSTDAENTTNYEAAYYILNSFYAK